MNRNAGRRRSTDREADRLDAPTKRRLSKIAQSVPSRVPGTARALPRGSFSGPGLGNAIGGPWLKTYAYDDLYRLTSSTGRHNTTPNGTNTYSFSQSYDSIHNITHKTQRCVRPRPCLRAQA